MRFMYYGSRAHHPLLRRDTKAQDGTAAGPGLRITVMAEDAEVSVVAVVGEIDLATAAQLRECLSTLAGRVVIDLAGVTFLDSSGIAVLVSQRNRLVGVDGGLWLRGPNDMVRRTLEIVGFADYIER